MPLIKPEKPAPKIRLARKQPPPPKVLIKTPRGVIVLGKNGKAQLKFDAKFAPKWTRRYSRAQKFVDNEVLRLSEPFTPLLTSMLIKSGQLGTDVGSGKVQWIAPYAKRQYYFGRSPGVSKTGPLHGRFWFERMKEVDGDQIIEGAQKIIGEG